MGLAIFGFGLWALLVDKRGWKFFLVPVVSFLIVYMLLGVGIDSWFYGEFVFAPYNYIRVNSEVSAIWFGSEPWWFYLYKMISAPTYFIGIPLALAVIYLIIRNPKNPYLWCLIPFFLVHSIIAHKEVRFLFPMAFLVPALLMSAYEGLDQSLGGKKGWKVVSYVLLLLLLVHNTIGIVANMSKPAGQQTCYLAKYINDNYNDEKVNIIHGLYSNPYGPYGGISGFYRNENATMQKFNNIYGLRLLLRTDAVNFFTCRKCDLKDMVCVGEFSGRDPFDVLKELGFEYVSQSMPKAIEKVSEYYPEFDDCDMLYVFRYVGSMYEPQSSDYKEARIFYYNCEDKSCIQSHTLTTDMSYSGYFSSLVYGDNCYGVTIEDSIPKTGDFSTLSASMYIYQCDTVPKASVAFELLTNEENKQWYGVRTVDITSKTNQWVNITANFNLQDNFDAYTKFKVYLYNPSNIKMYCDDIFAVFY